MTMKNRSLWLTLAALSCVGALALTACGKKEGGDKKKEGDTADNTMTPEAMGAIMAAKPAVRPTARPKPLEWVVMTLPKMKLKIKVPKGTKIEEGFLPNTDSVKFPGGKHHFSVRKWQHGDKPLEKVVGWAKGHQVQKHKGDVLKKGKGKLYTYIYNVTMGGRPGAVYHQYQDVGGKVFRCFANAKSATAAKMFHQACSSLAK